MQTLKQQIHTFNEQQRSHFAQQDIYTLLQERTRFYDDILHGLWQEFDLAEREDLALIAVGGYGRGEMFPLSDLDILVVCAQPLDTPTEQAVNALFNRLWDSGLTLGASLRTLEECIEIGKQTLSVATNMLEGRFLDGAQSVWQALNLRFEQEDFWPSTQFFRAKIAEKEARYARYHNTSYNLEPDLKHSPGGLRDLHLLMWIMLRHYRLRDLQGLFAQGILHRSEYEELFNAQTLLFRMRFALHLQLKRYDNRLRFDRQLQLSEQLGFHGVGNQPVEQMMKSFFEATQSVSQLTELLLAEFEEYLFPLQTEKHGQEKQMLDPFFSLQHNRVYCENLEIFAQQPHRILDLFYYLTCYPQATADIQTLRRLRLALRHLTEPMCQDSQARERFVALFKQPRAICRAVLPMHRWGVLTAYLPQWNAIAGLMQFDLFHCYTVDEHTVRVMLNLEQFLDAERQADFPLCCRLFPSLPNRHLLYFASLFHDIAKGRVGDHALEGAQDMREFARLHGFDQAECDYMAWLVEHHLTMSITAQRRDIHDPNVIGGFAKIVANPSALSALTCLTVADIYATNETLWNDWKRTLFNHLYQFTLARLNQGDELSINRQKQALAHKQAVIEQIKFVLVGAHQQKLERFWQRCPTTYFIRNTPTQLVWHALNLLKQTSLPMILVSNRYARGATEIFIYCEDRPRLFAQIAHTLSRKKISIHDAQIITGEQGAVLDSFIVTELNGKALDNGRMTEIQLALTRTLSEPTERMIRKRPPKHRSFNQATHIRFLDCTNADSTSFELFTPDREGLLAQIADIFNQLELNLLNAKITTIGDRVEDFFVVNTTQNQPLSEALKQRLQHHLLQALSE